MLQDALGRDPTVFEAYVLWQQGPKGGLALLTRKKELAVDVLTDVRFAALKNQMPNDLEGAQRLARAKSIRAVEDNGGTVEMTSEQFLEVMSKRFMRIYADVMNPKPPAKKPTAQA
jgi:hypothetical protein